MNSYKHFHTDGGLILDLKILVFITDDAELAYVGLVVDLLVLYWLRNAGSVVRSCLLQVSI